MRAYLRLISSGTSAASLMLLIVAVTNGIDLQSTSGLQLEAKEHKPPFGAMQPASVNPVASLPVDSSINNVTHSPLVRNRRQGLAGLEIAKDHNKYESYPKSTVVAQYTVTHTPLEHLQHRRRREAREHDFFLPAAPNTSDASADKKVVQLSQRSRRQTEEEGTIAAAGEPSGFAIQPTPFHTEVTLVPAVDGQHFVDPSNSGSDMRSKHKDKTIAKRQTGDQDVANAAMTRRKTTTTTVGWLKRIQQDTSSGLRSQGSRPSGGSGGIQTPQIPMGAV